MHAAARYRAAVFCLLAQDPDLIYNSLAALEPESGIPAFA